MFLLIAHFDVDPADSAEQALADAAEPVRLLAAQPDTRYAALGPVHRGRRTGWCWSPSSTPPPRIAARSRRSRCARC